MSGALYGRERRHSGAPGTAASQRGASHKGAQGVWHSHPAGTRLLPARMPHSTHRARRRWVAAPLRAAPSSAAPPAWWVTGSQSAPSGSRGASGGAAAGARGQGNGWRLGARAPWPGRGRVGGGCGRQGVRQGPGRGGTRQFRGSPRLRTFVSRSAPASLEAPSRALGASDSPPPARLAACQDAGAVRGVAR
jgi:hypothetical protein